MGPPSTLVSDSGGAYTSDDFEAVCTRLQIQHETIVSTQGESYQNWMETHFNIQRRLYDYQFSLARTPGGVRAAPSGLHPDLQHHRPSGAPEGSAAPADPGRGAGSGQGPTVYPGGTRPPLLPGRVPAHDQSATGVSPCTATTSMWRRGLPQTQVLLWVAGEQLRAVFEHVILAEYHCRYDWRDRHVKDIRQGVFHPTRFASPQGTLHPVDAPGLLGGVSRQGGRRRDSSAAPHTAVAAL